MALPARRSPRARTGSGATPNSTDAWGRTKRVATGVPAFAYGGHAAEGAVPPERLQRLVEGY